MSALVFARLGALLLLGLPLVPPLPTSLARSGDTVHESRHLHGLPHPASSTGCSTPSLASRARAAAPVGLAGVPAKLGSDAKQDPVDPRKPVPRVNPCVGCSFLSKQGDGYLSGARVRVQPGFAGRVAVVALNLGSRSGQCSEIASTCLELAPCALAVAALIRNTAPTPLYVRAGRDYVHTPFSPKPSRAGWIEIPKGGYCVYRTRARELPCNDIEAYARIDVRDAVRGKLVASIEWSGRCTRCVDRRR